MIDDINKDAETRMSKSIDSLEHELRRLRTGRASTALVEGIKVPYYGADTPLDQLANVAVGDPRTLTITVYDKSMIGQVEKALLGSDIGITPTTAGNVVRLNLPTLTEERRRELAKHVSHEGENAKIAVRNIRRDAMQHVKDLLKDKEISEDDQRDADTAIQKLTDSFVEKVDEVVKNKEDELMTM